MELLEICKQAKAIAPKIGILDTNTKNQALLAVADFLVKEQNSILDANKIDIENGKKNHMPEGLLDRLLLTEVRIAQMAEGLRQVAVLDDPIGEVLGMKKRPNGLMIGQKRVSLGVVGIIYEARPNVTADAFALCFKNGNVVILKGGSDAIHSNIAIVAAIRKALVNENLPEQAIALIEDTSRETAAAFISPTAATFSAQRICTSNPTVAVLSSQNMRCRPASGKLPLPALTPLTAVHR